MMVSSNSYLSFTMKKILLPSSLLSAIWLLWIGINPSSLHAQPSVASFDGVDDFVNLGAKAGNGIRTIELWFKLDQPITPNLETPVALVCRNTVDNTNADEFNLAFYPYDWPGAGALAFNVAKSLSEVYRVYSDQNQWNAEQWYHVAVVIDPSDGMMMFIDGVMQADTDSYNLATASVDSMTTLGGWGNRIDLPRFFTGQMDDVRFSSEAIYTSDFMPECPDAPLLDGTSTLGLWHFNEASGLMAIDSSQYERHATLEGAKRVQLPVCEEENYASRIKQVFVDPQSPKVVAVLEPQFGVDHEVEISLYSLSGNKALTRSLVQETTEIPVESLSKGLWIYRVVVDGVPVSAGKFIR